MHLVFLVMVWAIFRILRSWQIATVTVKVLRCSCADPAGMLPCLDYHALAAIFASTVVQKCSLSANIHEWKAHCTERILTTPSRRTGDKENKAWAGEWKAMNGGGKVPRSRLTLKQYALSQLSATRASGHPI